MNLLSKALIFATKAHAGQKDRGKNPYILHPIRMMLRCKTDEERAVALLHDVLEDTPSIEWDEAAFPERVMQVVRILTRRESEGDYFEYIQRIIDSGDELAIQMKIYDIEDNMDLSRIAKPGPRDDERNARYAIAHGMLSQELGELQNPKPVPMPMPITRTMNDEKILVDSYVLQVCDPDDTCDDAYLKAVRIGDLIKYNSSELLDRDDLYANEYDNKIAVFSEREHAEKFNRELIEKKKRKLAEADEEDDEIAPLNLKNWYVFGVGIGEGILSATFIAPSNLDQYDDVAFFTDDDGWKLCFYTQEEARGWMNEYLDPKFISKEDLFYKPISRKQYLK